MPYESFREAAIDTFTAVWKLTPTETEILGYLAVSDFDAEGATELRQEYDDTYQYDLHLTKDHLHRIYVKTGLNGIQQLAHQTVTGVIAAVGQDETVKLLRDRDPADEPHWKTINLTAMDPGLRNDILGRLDRLAADTATLDSTIDTAARDNLLASIIPEAHNRRNPRIPAGKVATNALYRLSRSGLAASHFPDAEQRWEIAANIAHEIVTDKEAATVDAYMAAGHAEVAATVLDVTPGTVYGTMNRVTYRLGLSGASGTTSIKTFTELHRLEVLPVVSAIPDTPTFDQA